MRYVYEQGYNIYNIYSIENLQSVLDHKRINSEIIKTYASFEYITHSHGQFKRCEN